MSTLHVGRHRIQTTSTTVPPIPPGALTVSVNPPTGVVSASVTPDDNSVRIDGTGVGSATITYSAAGYADAQVVVTVVTPPPILVVDGPEV